MKKVIKNLLAGVGVAAIGFVGYALLDEYIKAKEQALKEAREAKVRADAQAFIKRRKAHAAAKTAALQAKEEAIQQAVTSCTDTEMIFTQEEESAKTKESTAETDGKEAVGNEAADTASSEIPEDFREG